MATTIEESEQITLVDGTTFEVRPLRISLLRDFMKKFESISDVAEDNDKSMDILMECVQIAMKQYKPDLATDIKALEDNIDLPTVYRIVEAASGYSPGTIAGLIS
jgi:inhibitor of KinA sporulation pathway (predicted exonuclease)